ncbi:MAG: class I SAM-dependent methyltransferase [Eubacterium sp.]|nr:class I SAM-dependent methyltransferase [Eubacterium sp.]
MADLKENAEKPDYSGNPDLGGGKNMLERMNHSHAYLRNWAFPMLSWKPGMHILDVGCGGGAAIHEMLKLSDHSQIDGVDYSETSVKTAAETNAAELGRRVSVTRGNICSLPFADDTYDLVTAVETTYFWPDMEKAFHEIYRVLKKDGVVAVINEGSDPDLHTDWPNPDGSITIYRPEELTGFMKNAGFVDISVKRGEGDIILVQGRK